MSAEQESHEAFIPLSQEGTAEEGDGSAASPPTSRGFCFRFVTVMLS